MKIKILSKLEKDEDGEDCMRLVLESIRLLDHQIESATGYFDVTIPHNLSEFEAALEKGKTIVLHCVEGAHVLGRNLEGPMDYVRNLTILRQKGLCILTLAHFFKNSLCDSGGGIPPSTAQKIGYSREFITPGGLTEAGIAVVHECQESGIILDLTHSTVETRNLVYAIMDQRREDQKKVRPVIFSHTGIREVSSVNMIDPNDRLLLPNVYEIKKIKEYGGLFGIILMNYWTNGIEEDDPLKYDIGIPYIINTMKFIAEVAGDFDNIAIGSDLDGLSQTPDDVTHIRLIGRLRNAIVNEFGEANAIKICKDNALRIIRAGWS